MRQLTRPQNVCRPVSLAVAVLLICGVASLAQAIAPVHSAMGLAVIQSPTLATAAVGNLEPSNLSSGSDVPHGLSATLNEEPAAGSALAQSALPDPTPLLVLLIGSVGLVWSKPRH